MEFLKGKKTYALAILGIIYAISGYLTGHLDSQTAIEIGWAALTASALRNGMK